MIPAGTVRYQLLGTLPGSEVFAVGFAQAVDPTTITQSALDARLAVWNTNLTSSGLISALKPIMGTTTTITNLKAYAYKDSSGAATVQSQVAVSGATGTGTAYHPNQVALCVTLLTGQLGRTNRGRMYFPATGANVASTGLAVSTPIDTLVDALAAFFGTAASTEPVIVLSQKAGLGKPVSAVRADYRLDIQRRRANKQTVGTPHQHSVTFTG